MTSQIVAYLRVSTSSQDTALQLDSVRAAGAVKVFEEQASGAQRDRPQLRAALEYCRPGDCLVVYRLDRLARSVRQLVETAEALERRGIELRSLTESIDTSTPTGRLVFHMFAAIGQFERELIAERVRDGLKAAKARGSVGGRRRALDDRKIKTVRALLMANELSVAEIARETGVGVTTIYRNFPAARTGANAGGEWEAPKVCRVPPLLTPTNDTIVRQV